MDARRIRGPLLVCLLVVSMGGVSMGATSSHAPSMGTGRRTANFVVNTSDPALAAVVARAAEKFRRDLAVEWLGKAMPDWSKPCVMTVQAGPRLGAGGATTFVFDRGEVFGWRMTIQGSRERLLDSVLPHEITHMIYASHFRQPLPRWADEGGATSVEHTSEQDKHRQMLRKFLRTGRGIAFSRMFAMREYPPDVMPLYAQGYSLADYLIQQGGKRTYIQFLEDGLKTEQWSAAIARHYDVSGLGTLQTTWLAWVEQGSPPLKSPLKSQPQTTPELPQVEMVAVAERVAERGPRRPRPEPNLIYRMPKPEPYAPGSVVPAQYLATTAPREMAPQSEPRRLPADGWYAAGGRPPKSIAPTNIATSNTDTEVRPSATIPIHNQLAHPQPFEQPKQIILEWSRETLRR